MLICPNCKKDELSVVDSRLVSGGTYTRRRLECADCSERFTSHEIREMDLSDPTAIHFAQILGRLRSSAKLSKQPQYLPTVKKRFVLVRCCFTEDKEAVNY